jgi:hypothetical protein
MASVQHPLMRSEEIIRQLRCFGIVQAIGQPCEAGEKPPFSWLPNGLALIDLPCIEPCWIDAFHSGPVKLVARAVMSQTGSTQYRAAALLTIDHDHEIALQLKLTIRSIIGAPVRQTKGEVSDFIGMRAKKAMGL